MQHQSLETEKSIENSTPPPSEFSHTPSPQPKAFILLLSLLLLTSLSATAYLFSQNQALRQEVASLSLEDEEYPAETNPAQASETLPASTAPQSGTDPTTSTQTTSPAGSTSTTSLSYAPGKDWQKVFNSSLSMTLCLPPKWDFSKNGDGSMSSNLVYYRDPGYAPTITYIQSIPYSGGPKRNAYFDFWESEYPNVKSAVSIKEIAINGNAALLVTPNQPAEVQPSPEGLTVIWYAQGKLWKAPVSGWNDINPTQTAFLKDFYTAISCSF